MTKNEQRIELHSWFDMLTTITCGMRQRGQISESAKREIDNAIEQARDGVVDVQDGKPSM